MIIYISNLQIILLNIFVAVSMKIYQICKRSRAIENRAILFINSYFKKSSFGGTSIVWNNLTSLSYLLSHNLQCLTQGLQEGQQSQQAKQLPNRQSGERITT